MFEFKDKVDYAVTDEDIEKFEDFVREFRSLMSDGYSYAEVTALLGSAP